jgi:hypothetical protein
VSDLKLTVTSWGTVALDKRELRKVMRAAGNDVKSKTARLINASQGGGRTYFGPAGRYRASSPGSPPVRVSGDLRSSLKTYVFKSAEGFAVRAREFYALFLEVGARGGKPGSRRRRSDHRGLSESVRSARARARGENRVLEPRPFLDLVMAREANELDRRVRAALEHALTWKQTKAP